MSKKRYQSLFRYTRLTLRRKIRLLREQQKLSMKKLAAVIGLQLTADLNNNQELVDLALRVACVRGVPFSELMK